MVVALATIPTSVAYSTIIGLSPMLGIWSSAITGLVVACVGGGPGMIAGAAGVVALPLAGLVKVNDLSHISSVPDKSIAQSISR